MRFRLLVIISLSVYNLTVYVHEKDQVGTRPPCHLLDACLCFLSFSPELKDIRHERHNATLTSIHRLSVASTSARRCLASREMEIEQNRTEQNRNFILDLSIQAHRHYII